MRALTAVPVGSGPAALDLLDALAAALNGSGPALLPHLPGTAPPAAPATLDAAGDDPADPTVAVVATSGSTGRRRGVLLPASALLASASATHDRLGGPGRWLLALPVHHVAGLQVLIRSLLTRTRPIALDLSAGFDPEAFAAAAAALTGPRRYTALVPTQLVRLLDAGIAVRRELSRLDGVLIGGAALPDVVRARAEDDGVALVTTYGMTETCGGCVYDGRPLDGVRVRLDGDGRIHLGGPTIARGYLGASTSDAPGFGTDAGGERWFRTDDAGRWDDAAPPRLQIRGRLDDAVITGGVTVSPAGVEAALLTLPALAEVVVVGTPDDRWGQRLVAAVVLRPGAQLPPEAELRRVVAERIEPAAVPRQVMVLTELPSRGPGKPDRAAIARLAAGSGTSGG
ncbi:MAG: o-succinylbenzoate--CoA ligase [Kineosporiaceae bacterium]